MGVILGYCVADHESPQKQTTEKLKQDIPTLKLRHTVDVIKKRPQKPPYIKYLAAPRNYNMPNISASPQSRSITTVAKNQKIITTVVGMSSIIKTKQLFAIISKLPIKPQFNTWTLCYSSLFHGFSINTLFTKCGKTDESILIIKDNNRNIFGAYLRDSWNKMRYIDKEKHRESFLFKFVKYRTKLKLKVYHSTSKQVFCMDNKHDSISIGPGERTGIYIDGDLLYGSSRILERSKDDSFINLNKVHKDDGTFQIEKLEIWSPSVNDEY